MDPLALTKRIPKGSGLTPGEGDKNWTDIEDLANAHLAAFQVSHNDDGTLKDNVVPEAAVTLAALSKGYFLDTGTANAWIIAITPTPANLAALTGIPLHIKLNANVTSATQLTVTGVGSAGVRFNPTTELRNGDYVEDQIVEVVYDGTLFQAKSQITPGAAASGQSIGTFRNLVFQTTSVSTVSATAAEAVLVNANGEHATFSAISKTADWAATAGELGTREFGMSTAEKWVYVWLVCKSDLTGLGLVFSDSATVPSLGTGTGTLLAYTNAFYLLIGAVYNSASGSNLVEVYQRDRKAWVNEAVVFDNTSVAVNDTWEVLTGTPASNFAKIVPPHAATAFGTMGSSSTSVGVNGKISIAAYGSGAATAGLGATTCSGEANGVETNPIGGDGFTASCGFEVALKTAQLFYWKAINTAAKSRITISGYTW